MNLPPWMIPSDLAPGDTKSRGKEWNAVQFFRIDRPDHPLFDPAYQHLWDQFGPVFEIESREVLLKRLNWAREYGDLIYEMDLIMSGHDFVGVRDHSAILIEFHGSPAAVVHMSHNLVAPAWRRSGIAGWLRALPVETARRCLTANGAPADSPIILAGEMEYPDPQDEATHRRSVLDWDELEREPHSSMLRWYRQLLELRHRHPALRTEGPEDTAAAVHPDIGAFTVVRGQRVMVVVATGDQAVDVAALAGGGTALLTNDATWGDAGQLAAGRTVVLDLRPDDPDA